MSNPLASVGGVDTARYLVVSITVGEFTTFVPLSLAHRSQPLVATKLRFVVIPSRVESSAGNATASVSELRRIAICNHSRRCLACLVHNLVGGVVVRNLFYRLRIFS